MESLILENIKLRKYKFHHCVFDYMCHNVMFHRCGRGPVCGPTIHEQAHDRTYNKTFAISEDSDQPAHLRNERERLPYWVDAQADLSLCAGSFVIWI